MTDYCLIAFIQISKHLIQNKYVKYKNNFVNKTILNL